MRRNMNSRNHGGPLATDHLQLHDIDLELELLKRKRQMIEQQQQMLNTNDPFNRPRPFQYGNNQPQQSYQPFDQGYGRFNQPQSDGFGGRLLGKRPMNDQPWQGHSTPKRFSGGSVGSKRKFNSGPSPNSKPEPWAQRQYPPSKPFSQKQWKSPQPSSGPKSNFPSQRFNKPKTGKPSQNDFKPTKVTKAKSAASANKLASLPTAERAKVAKQAVKAKDGEDFILQSDKVPSQQLAGRLELALGNILKEIKTKYCDSEHGVSFQSLFLQRQMKQAIRERLRSVMMGQYVGKVGDIVDSYRKVFPVDTDAEIVQIAADAQQSNEVKQLAIKLEHAGTVYKYIKNNLNRLVGVTLDDMFEKLHKLYESDNKNTKDICREILAEEVPDLNKEEGGTGETESKEDSNVQDSAEEKDRPKDEETPNVAETEETANEEVTEKEETPNEEVAENQESEDTENKEQTEVNDNSAEAETTETTEKTIRKHDEAPHKLDGLVLSLIRRRLPYILPKYKNLMMKVLNASGAYQVTKTAILEKAQQQQQIDRRVAEARSNKTDKSFSDDATDSPNATTHNRNKILPYLVKIFGRPALPKRKIMQTYLNDFKPASVKKHRSMSLLFVAFSDKENYEKLLAVKETTVGNCTITVKASEKPASKPDESLDATSTSLDTTIPSDLDNQIDDLLSSIRNEEDIKEEELGSDAVENDDADIGSNAIEESNEEAAPELNGNAKELAVEDNQAAEEVNDKVEALKNDAKESGRATPTRASTRLSNVTPSSVRTRRASRLAN